MSRRSKRRPKVAWTSTRMRWTGDVLVETEAGMVARHDEANTAHAQREVLVLLRPDISAADSATELRRLAVELERLAETTPTPTEDRE